MRNLLFGIHCHQPLDNFHNVVNQAIAQSYLPFLQTAVKYPRFKFAAHYSGWLLEYIKNHGRETFALLQKLADNGQVEFFSGGFYEPILAAIPSDYRRMQIDKLNNFIAENFGCAPKGLWLTERVWEPSIIPDLAACGIEYVIVDDYHFLAAGFSKEKLDGYYLTEQDGCEMKVFPIDQKLRYMVPYKEVTDIDAYWDTLPCGQNESAAIIFDDGEKFGLWPGSYEWVYTKGWLERFLTHLDTAPNVRWAHFGEFARNVLPNGLAYLPSVSYPEMGEWALTGAKALAIYAVKKTLKEQCLENEAAWFVKGGIWQNFLVKYPEANRMHKRSLGLAQKARMLNDAGLNEIVCKTQVNDALWHGIFGGLYLPNLRNNLYRYIIEAENHIDRCENSQFPRVEKALFALAHCSNLSLRTAGVNYIFDALHNGQLIAFDDREGCFNYQNTLARHCEAYHVQMLETLDAEAGATAEPADGAIATIHEAVLKVDAGIKKYLHFDWYSRNSFVDHVVTEFDYASFARCGFKELSDFTNTTTANFSFSAKGEKGLPQISVIKNGGVFENGHKTDCRLIKTFWLNANGVLNFEIKLCGNFSRDYNYVMEFNFHFNDFKALTINKHALTETSEFDGDAFNISDANVKPLKLTFNQNVKLHVAVINTVSQSEKDVDLTAQGLALFVPFTFNSELSVSGSLQIL